jgi:uncharacterized protein (TIGR00251 family)
MRLVIRVRPGASRSSVGGLREAALLVSVTAPAVDGRATEAAVAAVAHAFGLRRRAVSVISGTRSRTKVLELDGDEAELARRLRQLQASA